jgi:hypothetical protein
MADRIHRLPAPPSVIYNALMLHREKWVRLRPGETMPDVLAAQPDESVVWSSFWPVSPEDTIEMALTGDNRTELHFQ